MNKPIKHKSRYPQLTIQIISDFLAFLLSYFIHYFIRFESGWFDVSVKPSWEIIILTQIVLGLYWYIIYFFSGLYKNWYERSPFEEIFKILKVNFFGCLFIIFLIFFDDSSLSRFLIIIYFLILTFNVVLFRSIAKRIEIKLRRDKVIQIPILIIGNRKESLEFANSCSKAVNWGYKVIGILLINDNKKDDDNHLIVGEYSQLREVISSMHPEVIVIAKNSQNNEKLMDIVNIAMEYKVRVKIEPDLYQIFTGQTRTITLYGIPLIEINTQLLKPWQVVLKRLFDIIFSGLVIILGLPLWLLIAIIIKIDSPGSVFYTQKRIGKDGKEFKIYKFRSMRPETAKIPTWTVVGDPRVTKFGRFIRKTHLDEIPQFLNVLIGDMSVVGPRPEQPKMVEEFAKELPYYNRRHLVHPGITGWWQINYEPHELSIEEIQDRLKYDFYYIENISLQLDFEIVIRTVWSVLSGHGQA